MLEYHKIQSVYLRDPATNHKTFLLGQWSVPAFGYLARNPWIWTEKIDDVCSGGALCMFPKRVPPDAPDPRRRWEHAFFRGICSNCGWRWEDKPRTCPGDVFDTPSQSTNTPIPESGGSFPAERNHP